MPQQALYLKWRPQTFEDVVGQEHITRTLRNSLKTGRIRHAYLFSGPRGTGKTSSARLLAKAVNCLDPNPEMRPCNKCAACVAVNENRFLDLIEIDAASHTGVDDVRELRDRIAFTPSEGRYKVYIIDEVHRFSGNAFDALLKTLEEPPDHALFILATTEIDKVPATIKSRCLPFEFRRLSLNEVADRLHLITSSEGIETERAALELIAREGTGSVRDSISLLDQIVADPEEMISLELAQRILGTASARAVRDLVNALVEKDTAHGLHIINSSVDAGSDPRQLGQQIVEHLRAVLLTQTASADLVSASSDDLELFTAQADNISRSDLLRAIRAFNEAVNTYSGGWQPQLALELALIESLQPREERTVIYQNATQQSQPTQPRKGTVADIPEPQNTEPAAIPVQTLREKWVEAQRLINQHKDQASDLIHTLPHLMDQVTIRSIDGNIVIAEVPSRLHLNKLNDETRRRWVDRAISRVADVALKVKFVLGEESDAVATSTPDSDDPLIETGLELGAEISEIDE